MKFPVFATSIVLTVVDQASPFSIVPLSSPFSAPALNKPWIQPQPCQRFKSSSCILYQSAEPTEQESSVSPKDKAAQLPETDTLTETVTAKPLSIEELNVISTIAQQDPASLQTFLMSKLPQMPPNTILNLRNAADGKFTYDDEQQTLLTDAHQKDLEIVGKALVSIMDTQLEEGRNLLQTLLRCGEIRKLDGAIARALKENKLDMAFFTVLNMNLRDAMMEEQIVKAEEAGATADGDGVQMMENEAEAEMQMQPTMGSGDNPGRLQILQHIYTRCQEEVEKTVSPGIGLLNKLLRTDQASIRSNQLQHYLCPQEAKTIKSPDGKEVQLGGSKALVKPSELIDALKNAVKQIRTVEKSGGADRAAAVGLVESCRQVAIEARLAVGEGYGVDSEELKDFEMALQPVFRPDTPDSEFIQGV